MPMADIELKDWIELSGSVTDEDRERTAPPPDLWTRIEAGLGEATAPSATSETLTADDHSLPAAQAPVIDLTQERTRRAPRARRRVRRNLAMAAAAAITVVVLGVSALTTQEDTSSYIAQATNAELPEAYAGTALASVNADADQISLEFSDALPSEEPVELWLIKPDLSDMVSLGLVQADGTFAVPDGFDVSEYSVVDLSIEPNDGDPTHSGRSILRGELQSA